MTSYHSRAVGCELCGQLFFPSSLPFHMKQCQIKQAFVEVPCPHCDKGVRNQDLVRHIERECRSSRVQAPPSLPSCCAVCGRRFAGDRLLKHQVICRRNNAVVKSVPKTILAPADSSVMIPWRERRDEMKEQIRQQKLVAKKGEFSALSSSSLDISAFTTKEHTNVASLSSSLISQDIESPMKRPERTKPNAWIDSLESLPHHYADSLDEPVEVNNIENEPVAWTVEWPGNALKGQSSKPSLGQSFAPASKKYPPSVLNLINAPPPTSPRFN